MNIKGNMKVGETLIYLDSSILCNTYDFLLNLNSATLKPRVVGRWIYLGMVLLTMDNIIGLLKRLSGAV